MKNANDILRMLDSLCYVLRDIAEKGDYDPDTAANTLELMNWLVQLVIGLRAKEEKEAAV